MSKNKKLLTCVVALLAFGAGLEFSGVRNRLMTSGCLVAPVGYVGNDPEKHILKCTYIPSIWERMMGVSGGR